MTATIIADNIRRLRTARAWTQEHLARAAALDVRTIQRAEKGSLLAAETLQAIAGALDVRVASLSLPDAEIEKVLAEFHAKTVVLPLARVERASALGALLGSADAFNFERHELTSDAEEDAAAEFEQLIRDTLDVWNEVEPIERRELEKGIQGQLEGLHALTLTVAAGMERRRLRFGTGDNTPMDLEILHVAIAPNGVPRSFPDEAERSGRGIQVEQRSKRLDLSAGRRRDVQRPGHGPWRTIHGFDALLVMSGSTPSANL